MMHGMHGVHAMQPELDETGLNLTWQVRAEALAPAGLLAQGPVARRLLARLARMEDEHLSRYTVVAASGSLLVLGADLPWVDGVAYCAPEPHFPGLWLPTTTCPGLPLDLLYQAALRRVQRSPLLLWHEPLQMVALDQAQPLSRPLLSWLGRVL